MEALDRAELAKAVIEKEGLFYTNLSTGAIHAHPAAKIENEARAHFLKAWDRLALAWRHNLDG